MKKLAKTIVGLAIGFFFSLIIYSKMEEWMPCTVPVTGQYNTYTSMPIFNFASMSILEYILAFLIFVAPVILSVVLLLLSESPTQSLKNSIQMIISLAVGIFTSILIAQIAISVQFYEFEGFGYNNAQWYEWILTFSLTLVPTLLALQGAYDCYDWAEYFWKGMLCPCIAGILVNVALFLLMMLIYLVTSGMIWEMIVCVLLFMAVTAPAGKLIIVFIGE